MVRLLTFTSLYPNAAFPRYGLFVEHRLRRLVETAGISARVVAPVPWIPLPRILLGRRAGSVAVPAREIRFDIEVRHPRFPTVPGLAVWANPLLMALAAMPTIQRWRRSGGDFDVIDAQYFYPDGVAGAIVAGWLGKPVVITARGTDVNVLSQRAVPRRWIRWAAGRASGLITVSQALKQVLVRLGVAEERIEVLRNGVDLDVFRPGDKARLRRELGIHGPTLLSVGNLVPEKGVDLVLEALARIEDAGLVVVGSGPAEHSLRSLARQLGVESRVRWVAPLDQMDLVKYYCAADATILASAREGMPNVLLESLACGTPVIATDVGGVSEVVQSPDAGRLVTERSPVALVDAWRQLSVVMPAPDATRAYALRFGWHEPVTRQLQLLLAVAAGYRAGAASREQGREEAE